MLIFPILIPLLVAILCLALGKKTRLSSTFSVIGAVIQLGFSLLLITHVYEAKMLTLELGGWKAPYGITLIADLFSAVMILVTSIVSLVINFYALHDINKILKEKHFYCLVNFLIMGVNGAFLTGDLFNLYVWFEVMLISSFVLMTLEGKKSQLEGGVKYLVINLFSSILFLCGLGLLYGKVGSLNMVDIAEKLAATESAFMVNSSAMLLLVAFCIKAGLFPFYFWLPASYHTPKTAITALFAALLTKVGVYALIRSYTLVFHTQFDFIQDILIILAAGTMIFGVFGAATQYDIKKILSFHIISQIGYIVMGLAIHTPLAIAGALFYTIHHIIVKTNLFLIAGLIERTHGTTDLKKLGGLYKWSPAFSLLFFIPAFSLGGIPPLSGFWAKFAVIQAGLQEQQYWLVAAALFVGIFTLFSMTKIWAEAFWKKKPEETPCNWSALKPSLVLPSVALTLLTIYLSISGETLFHYALLASEQLLNPQSYMFADPTP